MKRNIWMIPQHQAFLRRRAPRARDSREWLPIVRDLDDTWDSVAAHGIAAPQIGISRRVFVFRPVEAEGEGRPEAIINPKILRAQGEIKDYDGCLSVPGIYGQTRRAEKIELIGYDLEGHRMRRSFEGFTARIIQHEFDHLDGILFIDRLDTVDDCYTLKRTEAVGEDGRSVEEVENVPLTDEERALIDTHRVPLPGHALIW